MAGPKLAKLELQIMETLWTRGVASIREIQEAFPEKGRPAYTTVQTTVYRLEAKKAVRRVKKVGNFHIFAAAVSRDAAQSKLIDDLLALFGGRTQPGDRILMFYPPGLDFVVAFFGVLYAGAVAVPLVPPRRQGAGPIIEGLISNAAPAAILTSSHLAARLGHILSELRCSLQPLATIGEARVVK